MEREHAVKDPRVARLHYQVLPGEYVVFQDPPSTAWSTLAGILEVHAGHATIELTDHYPTEDEARQAVQPYLDAWEVSAGLSFPTRQRPFRFQFQTADVIDQAAAAGSHGPVTRARSVSASAAIAEQLTSFPSPPASFAVNPDVKRMWYRWEAYKSGRETLPAAAFYCLTVLEDSVGGITRKARTAAGQRYGIDPDMLNRLGDLVSEVGDEREARKAHRPDRRPYTSAERRWMEEVVLAIITRVGEIAADPMKSYATIDMNSLPPIGESSTS